MWALGLVIGGWIGSIGNFATTLLGAIAGLLIGALWSRVNKLSARVQKLEAGQTPGVPAVEPALHPAPPAQPSQAGHEAQVAGVPAVPEVPPPVTPLETVAETIPVEEPRPAPPLSRPMGAPATPREPSALWRFFFGGNTLVRVNRGHPRWTPSED